uniref:Carbonic anhydrase n=1 Tax=Sinocyclocheilus anshuiensis TaxID=1608454 RepID=A0A671N7S3_9TELE
MGSKETTTLKVIQFWNNNNFPNCGGQRQSPINIVTHRVKHDPKLTSFIFEGHEKVFNMSVENHGHSAHFTLPQSVRLRGGGLPATYKAVQFHLHWGENGGQGSEHSVDGERYPMELHIVHIKEKHGSLGEALNDSTGVAALAFFFEVTSGQNKQLDRVIEALGKVRYEGNSCEIEDFRLTDIIPQANKLNYYRYSGSLTTPGCDQAVVWTVFQQSLPISKNQVERLFLLRINQTEIKMLVNTDYNHQYLNLELKQDTIGNIIFLP